MVRLSVSICFVTDSIFSKCTEILIIKKLTFNKMKFFFLCLGFRNKLKSAGLPVIFYLSSSNYSMQNCLLLQEINLL